MANDYLKKEPSKTEKMLYQIAMAQNQMERGLWSTSTVVMALAILAKAKPEEIAEMMVNGDEKIKEFSQKVNEAVKRLEEARPKEEKSQT